MNKLSLWLQSLEQRERILVLAAGALVALSLIYLAITAPFYKVVDTRTARVERKQHDLVWLRAMAPTLRSLTTAQPTSNESLVVLIDRTARQAGLANAVTGQTPNGDRGMRVRLEAANFDTLIVWLASLQQQYGVGVESAAIDRTDKAGIINASLVLTRGAG